MKKVWIGILGISLVVACNSGTSESNEGSNEVKTNVEVVNDNISVEQAQEVIRKGNAVVIDVRSLDEFSSGHIDGALNIDINSDGFQEKLTELDMSKEYVVYCHSGKRSARSSELMMDLGFKNVHNVLGGISEWKANGYTVIAE